MENIKIDLDDWKFVIESANLYRELQVRLHLFNEIAKKQVEDLKIITDVAMRIAQIKKDKNIDKQFQQNLVNFSNSDKAKINAMLRKKGVNWWSLR